MDEYITHSDKLFYSYLISENIKRDTFTTHTHNEYELIYFLDGDATHVIEDRKYKLKRGDLILIRPFKYHFIQIDNISRYERIVIHFDNKIDGLTLFPDDVDVINIKGNVTAEDIFKKCQLYYKNCSENIFFKLLPHLISELLYNIHIFPNELSKEYISMSPLITKAIQYINDNLCEISGVEDVANHLFVSESYLFRLFKNELHRTPKKYILEKRLILAEKLLSYGEKPTKVSEKCGFTDYTTFYRNYINFFGHLPSYNEKNL